MEEEATLDVTPQISRLQMAKCGQLVMLGPPKLIQVLHSQATVDLQVTVF